MNIRAMVFDLDRTLLRSDRTISAYTESVLERCRAKGICSVIATARPPRAIRVYEEMIRPDAAVTMNGASLRMNGRERRSVSMDAQAARKLIREIDKNFPGRPWSLEAESGLYANFDTSTRWDGPPAPIITADTVPDERAYKVLTELRDAEDADLLRFLLPEDSYLEIAEGTLGMVIHKNATKMQGVLAALRDLGVNPEDAAAFGDDLADIEMLRVCGCGVAVENALDAVKAAADFIAESNDDDGVAKWLEAHVLR